MKLLDMLTMGYGKRYYRITADGEHTVCVRRLPTTIEEQIDYLGAEMLLLCVECSIGTMTEDKIYDYTGRIVRVITMDSSSYDYALSADVKTMLRPIVMDKELYKPELSYDDAIQCNKDRFLALRDELILKALNYRKTEYFR